MLLLFLLIQEKSGFRRKISQFGCYFPSTRFTRGFGWRTCWISTPGPMAAIPLSHTACPRVPSSCASLPDSRRFSQRIPPSPAASASWLEVANRQELEPAVCWLRYHSASLTWTGRRWSRCWKNWVRDTSRKVQDNLGWLKGFLFDLLHTVDGLLSILGD